MQKALDSNLNNSINEFYEFRNFINTWSQDNNYTNLLLTGYECKPVKSPEEVAYFQCLRFMRDSEHSLWSYGVVPGCHKL